MIDLKELYWATGFIEGEGCFTFHRQKARDYRCGTLTLKVSQKYREPLDRTAALFGGSVKWQPANGIWAWNIHGKKAAGAVMTIYCLLSPRRKAQALEALNGWKIQAGNGTGTYRGKYLSPRVRRAIKESAAPTGEVAREFGVSGMTVWKIRGPLRKKSGAS